MVPRTVRPRLHPTRHRGLVTTLLAGLSLAAVTVSTGATAAAAPAKAAPYALRPVTLGVPAGLGSAPFDSPRTVSVPAGWTAQVWARVPAARLAAWAPDGSLLVSQPGSGQVTRLQPGAAAAAVPTQQVLVAGLKAPHGLAFDGTTLYVAESNQVDAYTYAAGGVLSGRRVVLGGLPDSSTPGLGGAYAHALKSVLVGADHALYVSIGSSGNISAADRTATPERATILRVPPGGGVATVYARGVRNGTGLALDPTGAVWTAVNNRDDIAYPYHRDYDGNGSDDYGKVMQSYVNDHPAEEIARLTPGRDLGWPYCNPDPDVSPGVAGTAYDYSRPPFVRDAQLNADGSALNCAKLARVEQTIGAHSAPLGMSFLTSSTLPTPWRTGAVVASHGSWDRQPPRAPQVSFFAWNSTRGQLGAQRTLMSGFQLPDGSRWGRPVDAVAGPDGALYVTDDAAGAVYRLAPPA